MSKKITSRILKILWLRILFGFLTAILLGSVLFWVYISRNFITHYWPDEIGAYGSHILTVTDHGNIYSIEKSNGDVYLIQKDTPKHVYTFGKHIASVYSDDGRFQTLEVDGSNYMWNDFDPQNNFRYIDSSGFGMSRLQSLFGPLPEPYIIKDYVVLQGTWKVPFHEPGQLWNDVEHLADIVSKNNFEDWPGELKDFELPKSEHIQGNECVTYKTTNTKTTASIVPCTGGFQYSFSFPLVDREKIFSKVIYADSSYAVLLYTDGNPNTYVQNSSIWIFSKNGNVTGKKDFSGETLENIFRVGSTFKGFTIDSRGFMRYKREIIKVIP